MPLPHNEATSVGDLSSFKNPRSVAVVGASAEKTKWGYWLAIGAIKGESKRQVYFVNRSGGEILGKTAYASLHEVPEVPELIAISVPASAVFDVIEAGLALGTKAFVVVSARVENESEIAALLKAHDAHMVGPNSLGVYFAEGELQLMWGAMTPGTLAIVSQSGQIGSEIAALGVRERIGISSFVSLGNQVDLSAKDILKSLASDDETKTVALYLEDFSQGVEVVEAISDLRSAGKAVLILTTGESDASKNLAQTHTGAMTSDSEIVDAACRAAGAVRVHTPSEVTQIAAFIERAGFPQGRRVAIVSDSGGQGGIAADAAVRLGLEVPQLSENLRSKLDAILPPSASSINPIDLAGAGEADMRSYATLTRILAESGEVDSVVLSGYFGCYGKDVPEVQDIELEIAREIANIKGAVIALHTMESDSRTCIELMSMGVPVSGRVEDVLGAISGAEQASRQPRLLGRHENLSGTELAANFDDAKEMLSRLGIMFPESRVVKTTEEAAQAAKEMNTTVVLKAGGLMHKSEMKGVKLGLASEEAVVIAFEEMFARLGEREYTLEIQDLREHTAEFIVNARRDSNFGPVVSVGFGGVQTEVWNDLSIELGPVDYDTAKSMILNLRSSKLIAGWRGTPALNMDALVKAVVATSDALCSSSDLDEIELNPIRLGQEFALAVDCLVIPAINQFQKEKISIG
jgi:acyl-CoA synthetase (NDP forming)